MELVCVDNIWGGIKFDITIGKRYVLIAMPHVGGSAAGGVYITNDSGAISWYRGSHFVTIEEYRDKIIGDLLDG